MKVTFQRRIYSVSLHTHPFLRSTNLFLHICVDVYFFLCLTTIVSATKFVQKASESLFMQRKGLWCTCRQTSKYKEILSWLKSVVQTFFSVGLQSLLQQNFSFSSTQGLFSMLLQSLLFGSYIQDRFTKATDFEGI